MKLLFYLTRYPGVGGIECVSKMLADNLSADKDAKYKIEFVSHIQQTSVESSDYPVYFMPDGIKCSADNFKYFDNLLKRGNYDCVIFQDSYAPIEDIVCKLSHKYNIPLLVYEHSSPNHIYVQNFGKLLSVRGILQRLNFVRTLKYRLRQHKIFNYSSRYVLLSKFYIPDFCRLSFCSSNNDKLRYINNPVTTFNYVGDGEKQNVILTVCQLVSLKAVDKMLIVWEQLSNILSDWRFEIVGDGPMRHELENFVKEKQIKRVTFIGFANPAQYYSRSKIFWMASTFEGWPMTLCESMNFGCVPIVMNTFSSAQDIIANGVNGFLIDNYSLEEFIDKTLLLANNQVLLEEMGVTGKKSLGRFTTDKIIKAHKQLLNEVITKRKML